MIVHLVVVARQNVDRQGPGACGLLSVVAVCCVTREPWTAVRFDREFSSPLVLGWASHGSYDMQWQRHRAPRHRGTAPPLPIVGAARGCKKMRAAGTRQARCGASQRWVRRDPHQVDLSDRGGEAPGLDRHTVIELIPTGGLPRQPSTGGRSMPSSAPS